MTRVYVQLFGCLSQSPASPIEPRYVWLNFLSIHSEKAMVLLLPAVMLRSHKCEIYKTIVNMQEENDIFVNFSARFSELLDNCELSQKQLASRLGITEGAIINYKRGRIPKALELLRIANYFNVSMEWLLTGRDREPQNLTPSAWEMRCRRAEDKLGIAVVALKGIIGQIEK